MMLLLTIILLLYGLSILGLIYGFSKVKTYTSSYSIPKTKFSILVPFRNEAKNLPQLLESLTKLDYPTDLFELILIDDESEEKFVIQDFGFRIKVVQNNRVSNSPKKDAITTAMQIVKTDWIITTDADCIVPQKWLSTLDDYIQNHNVEMLAGAVRYECGNSFLHHFQQLDLASLQGATIGSFGLNKGFMCNGANFAYSKSFFVALNGFEGNDAIASGDDVFLLQKAIAHAPESVQYLKSKNTTITTNPVDNWQALFYQRVRWAAKTTAYKSQFGKGLGIVVFLGNLTIILLLFFMHYQTALFLIGIKIAIDAGLILKSNRFLSLTTRYLVLSSVLYPFWAVTVALYSVFGSYEWKGRTFKQ
ncbi:glycosyltransferase family 2 protein [Flavobacterium sp. 7A]|uniref:glycosyltransferase family 2 protein n=1 Tax=Flavobacterium sp. 7A TaxID=2940571 RepID=UPI002226D9B3|nr:glycosyltransferase [Flavobacterium sp. 7A]MCW2118124.1 glycosyltransferase involved in cell wall biosynthesis [Flavobacterium sp. 7A]